MTFQFDQFSAAVRAGGNITALDTQALRHWAWADGMLSQRDAQALFELNSHAKSKDPEWIAFFTEAVCDFVIDGSEPKGYVSEKDALWVIEEIDKDGRVESAGELELLVKLAEKAVDLPNVLKFYALDQIERIIISGEGPTREGDVLRNTVTAAEANLLRRLIFASGSHGPAIVSREEADMLFRIKDACLESNNAPEWEKLFVQGVANHLQGFSAYTPLTRERATQLESFMRSSSPSIGRFFKRMGDLDLSAGFAEIFRPAQAMRDLDSEVEEAEAISLPEKGWLDHEIAKRAGVDRYEQALLDFVAS
ncbi:hypothetical protein [uncultured Sphingorhabdus sp.]|uniref:hypothetical protein n=1 Tax=uncultured Sphingorhabdus sp. TaxID=1686106 RepID=UPI002625C703|nr:hypothetical protein [uncultured Sphingorhabdus sp.]HMS20701.1 hypothetical protein [Sphingorhabdus sp.]